MKAGRRRAVGVGKETCGQRQDVFRREKQRVREEKDKEDILIYWTCAGPFLIELLV